MGTQYNNEALLLFCLFPYKGICLNSTLYLLMGGEQGGIRKIVGIGIVFIYIYE